MPLSVFVKENHKLKNSDMSWQHDRNEHCGLKKKFIAYNKWNSKFAAKMPHFSPEPMLQQFAQLKPSSSSIYSLIVVV